MSEISSSRPWPVKGLDDEYVMAISVQGRVRVLKSQELPVRS